MSTNKNKQRDLGQVFTPEWTVKKILDLIGFTEDNPSIADQRIIEPSAGEGVFLQEAVKRLINVSRDSKTPDSLTAEHLSQNVVGIDLDPDVINVCIENLNTVLTELNFKEEVDWKVFTADALSYTPDEKFDFVVGNPPYIRIHNMPAELREAVKKFPSSTGTTDIYVIFFELGVDLLNDTGKLGYISSNSWLKNTSQKSFRKMLIDSHLLSDVIDYGSHPVFDDADAYTAIAILDKSEAHSLKHTKMYNNTDVEHSTEVKYDSFASYDGSPLVFNHKGMLSGKDGVKIKDVCTIQNGVSTLQDKVFVNPPGETEEPLTRPVIKASRYKGGAITDKILFPYKRNEAKNSTIGFTEDEISEYPEAYKYLESHRKVLASRSLDKSALWFHYGRSQGIKSIHKEKLSISTIVSPSSEKITAYKISGDVIVYSGLFATTREDSKYTLDDIIGIIESDVFHEYAWAAGKDMSGGYRYFSARIAGDFVIPEELLK